MLQAQLHLNSDEEQCFGLQDTAVLLLEQDFQFSSELNADSTNEETILLDHLQVNNTGREFASLQLAAPSKIDMINQQRKKPKENQMKKKRHKKVHDTSTLMLKSSTLKHSAITEDLNDSNDDSYMDDEKWETYKDNMDKINPLISRDDKDAFTNSFFEFLSGWTHLKYLRNGVFQRKRYTGYIGVRRNKVGILIDFAFDDLYIESMCGLTQAFLNNTIKAFAGRLI
jgi:hypothetical protein